MNSRRFTASASRASDRKDSTPQYGRRLLRCGIPIPLMSLVGQVGRIGALTMLAVCPLCLQ